MKNRNIKRKLVHDRKFPSREQIGKHQNFDRLTGDYRVIKKLLLKKTILWSVGIVAVAAISSVLFLTNRQTEPKPHTVENVAVPVTKARCILPPLPGKDIAFTDYYISAKDGGTIEHTTGSKIIIPPSAFTREDHVTVSDSILIRYREMHDASAIFLSGIPMNYDSAGIARVLESAGMIEIHAFDGKQEIAIAPQKKIDIRMVSLNDESRFNLYELDTLQNNWIYRGKYQVQKIVAETKKSVKPVQQIVETQKPIVDAADLIQPQLADPKKYSFKITYDAHIFPELAAYENMLFEVTEADFKPSYYKIHWDRISLENGNKEGTYIVNLKKKDTTIRVKAIPVFNTEHYEKALFAFREKHNHAKKIQQQKETTDQAKQDAVQKELSVYDRRQFINSAAGLTPLSVRSFSLLRTGVFNCDFPLPIADVVALANTFTVNDAKNNPLTYTTIFMMEKGKNTVFRFSKNEHLRFNSSAQHLIWTVTGKNQIAFFNASDFPNHTVATKKVIMPVLASDQNDALNKIKQFCN